MIIMRPYCMIPAKSNKLLQISLVQSFSQLHTKWAMIIILVNEVGNHNLLKQAKYTPKNTCLESRLLKIHFQCTIGLSAAESAHAITVFADL